jgi:agmatine deiminase
VIRSCGSPTASRDDDTDGHIDDIARFGADFYLANAVALVPVFDVPTDTRALEILADQLPGREIVGIASRDLVVGLGAVNCLTLQEPL